MYKESKEQEIKQYHSSDESEEEEEKPPKLTAVEQEFVHNMGFDYYGDTMVTGGADQKLKIWRKLDKATHVDEVSALSPIHKHHKPHSDFERLASPIMKQKPSVADYKQNMYLVDEWEAHSGPILKLTFAHPQYGQVFASCTENSEVFIWEEKVIRKPGTSHTLIREWIKLTELKVSKDKIQDIQFSPEHGGIKLLVLYKKGNISIFQAKLVTDLTKWKLISEINGSKHHVDCNAIGWLPDENYDLFAVGSNTNSKELSREPSSTVGEETKDSFDMVPEANQLIQFFVTLENDLYLKGPFVDPLKSDNLEISVKNNPFENMDSILALKFAPNYGKSYSTMVTCDEHYNIDVWKLNLVKQTEIQKTLIQTKEKLVGILIEYTRTRNIELKNMLTQSLLFDADNGLPHNTPPFSLDNKYKEILVGWNITGTMFAVSSDVENISVFKQDKLSKAGIAYKMIANFSNSN